MFIVKKKHVVSKTDEETYRFSGIRFGFGTTYFIVTMKTDVFYRRLCGFENVIERYNIMSHEIQRN